MSGVGAGLRRGLNRWVVGGLAVVLLLAVALVVWFGLFNNYQLPVPRGIGDGDKMGHVAGFGLVALAAGLLFGSGWRLGGLLCIAAVVLECVQLFLPTRQASFGDALASMAGVGLGLAAAFALAALTRRAIRSWPRRKRGGTGRGGTRRGEERP